MAVLQIKKLYVKTTQVVAIYLIFLYKELSVNNLYILLVFLSVFCLVATVT